MTTLSLRLFERLEAAGVAHCHWKSNVRLADSLAGVTDIDLLVADTACDAARAVLSAVGMKRFDSPAFGRYAGIEDWLGFDEPTARLLHVQLHDRLVTGHKFVKEQGLPWSTLVLDTSVHDSEFGVRIPCSEMELLILHSRIAAKTSHLWCLLGGHTRAIPGHIRDELDVLRGLCEPQRLRELTVQLFPGATETEIDLLTAPGAFRDTGDRAFQRLRLVRHALRPWRSSSIAVSAVRSLLWKVYVRAAMVGETFRVSAPIKKRPETGGRLIAIVGADGSGKSTVVSELTGWLRWKIEARSFYLGNDRGVLVSCLRAIYRGWRGASSPAARAASSSHRQGGLVAAVRAWRNASVRHRELRRAMRARENGLVVLTDRFPQGSVTGMFDGPSTEEVPERGLCAWVRTREQAHFRRMRRRSPDVVIKLCVPAEIACSRKPDHEPEQVRRKCEAVRRLEFPGAGVHEVDASQPLDAVLSACKRIIWNAL